MEVISMLTCRICNKNYETEFLPKKLKNICSLECFRKSGSILVESKCEQCGVIKIKPPSQIYKHTFCSTKCAGTFNAQFIPPAKTVKVNCGYCKKEFFKKPTDTFSRFTKLSRLSFCSRICKGKYDALQGKGLHDPNYIKSNLRSKLELYIEEKIKQYFPYLSFTPNDRITLGNGTELDFYFPDLIFAIEINGICHYVDIYGKKQSIKTFTKDKEKIRICEKKGITLMVVKSTERFYDYIGEYYWIFVKKELLKFIPYCENNEPIFDFKFKKPKNEIPEIYENSTILHNPLL